MKKIIITGFSHTGTTILREVLGRLPGVYAHPKETTEITPEILELAGKAKTIVIKTTELIKKADYPEYEGWHRVYITRNPLFVFSSILRRMGELKPVHSVARYKRFLNQWKNIGKYGGNWTRCRYEDLVEDEGLKTLIKSLGLRWRKKSIEGQKFAGEKPEETDHGNFRRWQISQPFQNMNDPEKIDLPASTEKALRTSNLIQSIYPQIKEV